MRNTTVVDENLCKLTHCTNGGDTDIVQTDTNILEYEPSEKGTNPAQSQAK